MESGEGNLRYITASRVQTPLGSLAEFDVLDNDDGNVGKLEGVLVDPAERAARYLVVKSRRALRAKHYLLPLAPATVDAANKALHVDVQPDDLDELDDSPAKAFAPFSDEDLITALFAKRAH